MRVLAAVVALVAACAAPKASSVEPAPAAVEPARAPPAPTSRVAQLAERIRRERVPVAGWPVRDALPKPDRCYDVAFLFEDAASDGWSYELLVDPEIPGVLWARRTGTIVGGVVSYLGPAMVVEDGETLVLRVGER